MALENKRIKVEKLIQQIAKEQGYSNHTIELKESPPDANHYSSTVYFIKISAPEKTDLRLFAKVANITEDFRKSSYARIFQDEHFFYTELVPAFRKIEEHHKVPEEDRVFLPRFYGGDPTPPDEIIVLEDLKEEGFNTATMSYHLDSEYASIAMDQIAKFHALSFVYSTEKPKIFQKILEEHPYHIFLPEIMRDVGFTPNLQRALKELKGERQEKLKKYFEEEDRYEEMLQLYQSAAKRVIVHGDFKINNLMHRRNVQGSRELMPVDFQIIHAGCPATDIIYFIFLGINGPQRRCIYEDLLDYYYECLTSALRSMNVDVDKVYPRKTFDDDLKEVLKIGLVMAVSILPIMIIESESRQDDDDVEMFINRLTDVVDDYIQWGIVK